MPTDNRQLEQLATQLVDSTFRVHSALGPGLLESTYQHCLEYELRKRGIAVRSEVLLPVRYDGCALDAGYRLDMLVEEQLIVENKAVSALLPVHHAQILTYLRLSGLKLGFLINWNVPRIKEGLRRVVNGL